MHQRFHALLQLQRHFFYQNMNLSLPVEEENNSPLPFQTLHSLLCICRRLLEAFSYSFHGSGGKFLIKVKVQLAIRQLKGFLSHFVFPIKMDQQTKKSSKLQLHSVCCKSGKISWFTNSAESKYTDCPDSFIRSKIFAKYVTIFHFNNTSGFLQPSMLLSLTVVVFLRFNSRYAAAITMVTVTEAPAIQNIGKVAIQKQIVLEAPAFPTRSVA